MQKITVTVAGSTKSGKSRISLAIIDLLQQYGIECSFTSTDFSDKNELLEHCGSHLDNALNIIGERTVVDVVESQVVRLPAGYPVSDY